MRKSETIRTARRPRAPKRRGYSRAFTPKTEQRVQIFIDWVPPALKAAALAKAKREGISLRAQILGWLQAWTTNDASAVPTAARSAATTNGAKR